MLDESPSSAGTYFIMNCMAVLIVLAVVAMACIGSIIVMAGE